MRNLKFAMTAALLMVPSAGLTQGDAAKLGQKQKAWMVANFQSFACALTPGSTAAVTGTGTVSFDASADGGVDLTVVSGDGGVPTITAHAINTKGTGASNGRAAAQPCGAIKAPSDPGAANCSLSGDDQSPAVHFSIPLAALGGPAASESYVGTVTIVKGPASEPMVGQYLSKKGYQYYQARSDLASARASADPELLVIARCDSAKLISKSGKPMTSTYDLAFAKK